MISPQNIILSTAYFPPIEYFHRVLYAEKVFIENCENYQKQSYRNRCEILGPNGKQSLVIPLTKNGKKKAKISEVEIFYQEKWLAEHIRSIKTAYKASPFFIHYSDGIFDILNSEYKYINELNFELLKLLLKYLGIKREIEFTNEFISDYDNASDFRELIHPKQKSEFSGRKYIQVFNDRFEFIPNLSIIDLIFNLGPEAISYLK